MRRLCLITTVAFALAGFAAACVGDDPSAGVPPTAPPGSDGGPGSPTVDGRVEASTPPRCRADGPWGPPEIVSSLSAPAYHSLGARPAGDFLYFASDRHDPTPNQGFANIDLFRARASGDVFTDVTRLTTLAGPDEDVGPTESADGLTLYFAAGGISIRRIKRTTRQRVSDEYPAAAPLTTGTIVPGAIYETDPYLVGSRLYFSAFSAVDGGSETVLHVVDVGAGGLVGSARPVPGSFRGNLRQPVVNAAETEIYFTEINGAIQKPFVAKRTTTSIPFAAPLELTDLEVRESVATTGLSADSCELYLAARNTAETFAIYRSRRPRP